MKNSKFNKIRSNLFFRGLLKDMDSLNIIKRQIKLKKHTRTVKLRLLKIIEKSFKNASYTLQMNYF